MAEKIRKIHCVEMMSGRLDNAKLSMEKLRNMIGYSYPTFQEKLTDEEWKKENSLLDEWDNMMYEVPTLSEGGHTVRGQTDAAILGGIHEIKAMLILLLEKKKEES